MENKIFLMKKEKKAADPKNKKKLQVTIKDAEKKAMASQRGEIRKVQGGRKCKMEQAKNIWHRQH